MTWPNRITYSRLMLVPLFIIAVIEIEKYPAFKYVAVALFAVIAIGDAMDGYIAHRFNMETVKGKFIDPLADKMLMTAASVLLALPLWALPGDAAPLRVEIAVVIIARDFIIMVWVVAAFMAGAKMEFEASRLGKWTTFVQMLMLTTMLVGTIWLWLLRNIGVPLSYAAAALTIISGLDYLYRYAKKITFSSKAEG